MKKAFVTGITGTVAPYLSKELKKDGYLVFDKHFRINDDSDLKTLRKNLDSIQPDVIFHLALGPISYVEELVDFCTENSKTLVYISTVSVYEDNDGGPYNKDDIVKVKNDYGKYKFECEEVVRFSKCRHFITRIGWQISHTGNSESNNMLNFIKNNKDENNVITVSDKFYPSTSFLDQTAKALKYIYETQSPDLYLVNSNLDKSLYEIVLMLKDKFNLNVEVEKDSSFSRNDIMIDDRVKIDKF